MTKPAQKHPRVTLFVAAFATSVGALSFPLSGFAQVSSELKIWPENVGKIWGYDSSNCVTKSDTIDLPVTTRIDPALCPYLADEKYSQSLLSFFRAQMRANFKNSIENILDGKTALESNETALSNTLVAHIFISRAEMWKVKRLNLTDYYFPITMSLNIFNIESGEIVYTERLTVNSHGVFSDDQAAVRSVVGSALNRQNPQTDQFFALVQKLVISAASKFHPENISGKVVASRSVDSKTSLYVYDKGLKSSIKVGDQIGESAHVIYSTGNYSVLKTYNARDKLSVGDVLLHHSNSLVGALDKPSVFVVFGDLFSPSMSRSYVRTLFEDKLGQGGVFSIIPDSTISHEIRDYALSQSSNDALSHTRPNPDYIVRLQIWPLPAVHMPTNIPGVSIYTFRVYAFGDVLDQSGKIVYSTMATDSLADQVSLNIAFSEEDRQDLLTKNVLGKLADQISKGFKPKRYDMPVSENGGRLSARDSTGALSTGVEGNVLRKIGKINGIEGEVFIPVALYKVSSIDGDKAYLTSSDPLAARLREGDSFEFAGSPTTFVSRTLYGQCESQTNNDDERFLSKLVGVSLASQTLRFLKEIANNVFYSRYALPIKINNFDKNANTQMKMQGFPGDDDPSQSLPVRLHDSGFDRCMKPATFSFKFDGYDRAGGQNVFAKINFLSGFVVYEGSRKVLGSANPIEEKGQSFIITAADEAKAASIISDVAESVRKYSEFWVSQNRVIY